MSLTICPKPEHLDDAREAIRAILDETRAEPGCLAFDLHEGVEDGRLHLYERWRDRAALDAHHAEPYTRAVFHSYEAWLAAPVELVEMRPVA